MRAGILRKVSLSAFAIVATVFAVLASSAMAKNSFTLTPRLDTRFEVTEVGDHMISGMIKNTTSNPIDIRFQRTQTLPDGGWATSVCFGTSCFAPFVDTSTGTWEPDESKELILHVIMAANAKSDSMVVTIVLQGMTSDPTDTVQMHVLVVYHPTGPVSFSLDQLESGSTVFSGGGDHTMTGSLSNITPDNLNVFFDRAQQLPTGWSSYLCFGSHCFKTTDDTGTYVFQPGDVLDLTLHVNSGAVTQTDSGVVWVRLMAMTGVASDTILLRLVAVVQAAGVGGSTDYHAGPTVQSFYPSPVRPGSQAALDLYSPVSTVAQISVTDILGRTVADLGNFRVSAGRQKIALAIPQLAEGSYVLRVGYTGYLPESRRISVVH